MGHLLESSEMDGSEAMRIWKEAQYATRPSNLKNLSIQEMEHWYGQLYGIRPYLVQYNHMSEFCLAQMDLIRKEVELKRIEHMNAKRHRINIRLARRSLAIGKSGHKMNWWILIFSGIALVLAAVSLVLQYLASK